MTHLGRDLAVFTVALYFSNPYLFRFKTVVRPVFLFSFRPSPTKRIYFLNIPCCSVIALAREVVNLLELHLFVDWSFRRRSAEAVFLSFRHEQNSTSGLKIGHPLNASPPSS